MDASAESSQSTKPCISTEREKPEPWIRFGLVYGDEDTEVDQIAKQSAWSHFTRNDRNEYLRSIASIASVEDAAKNCYDSSIVDRINRDPHRFVETMAKDGCIFLQLALHILGAGELLGYPPQHLYLGEDTDSCCWIPSMFFVGNQIPYVVINALMEQTFFKNVIAEGMERDTWKRLRDEAEKDLAKLALYKVVVEPQLTRRKKRGDKPPPPSDILEALRNLFLGSRHKDLISHEIRAFHDLETGSVGLSDDDRFPSATTLSAISGINLKKGKAGITNIKFTNIGYSAYLKLPPFTIDSHTEILLTSLVRYEKTFHENKREVTAYLCLMKDLILTYEDIHILETQGIIQFKDQSLKGDMISMLHKSHLLKNSHFTPNFSQMRCNIREYEAVPWRRISFACGIVTFIVAFCTIVQTVYTVLSFYLN